jgi:hypothetical protein
VSTDLDTFATALQVTAGDLLKESPQLGPWRRAAGITRGWCPMPGSSTLAVTQALLGFTS